jgi:ABC-type antimicrobial peptide transport system permease subunit
MVSSRPARRSAVRLIRESVTTVYDARLWIAAVIAIMLAASIGTGIPAWRASRVDPVQALRTE